MKASFATLRLAVGAAVSLLFVPAAPAVFKEINGLIVIEAENFQTNRPAAAHYWQATNHPAGFVGDAAMQAWPNNGANLSSNIQTNSPALIYLGNFTNAGTFNFWVRAWGANGSDDSIYVGVDGNAPQSLPFSATGAWAWQAKQVTLSAPGVHQINVWMREDGALVDRIVLAADLSYRPTGDGPPELHNEPPLAQITSPPDGLSVRAGVSLALSANASDPDGSVTRVDFFSDGELQASLTNAPYFLKWTPPAGTHVVQAVATDNEGATNASPAITVTLTNAPWVGPTFRYASTGNRIYVENGGTTTLTEIKSALPNAPLQLVDAVNKVWLLRANVIVADGCTLRLHGDDAGGDVNELRLLSNNSGSANTVINVDADWGTIDLNSTRVTSWNEALNGPATRWLGVPRSFLRARSRGIGPVIQQSTLNIVNSEVKYLGANDAQGRGLIWQVVSAAPHVTVFGNVSGSSIHHCQLGVGTWSVDDVRWANNGIAVNRLYDFDATNPGAQAVLTANYVSNNDYAAALRWSAGNGRLYATGPGNATLTDLKAVLPQAPLDLVDAANKVWLLRANLIVENGATFFLHGIGAPGEYNDCNELRLLSNSSTASNSVATVVADWGILDLHSTRVTSWDAAIGGPDTDFSFSAIQFSALPARAFIAARSRLVGAIVQESTLNVINSDIGYLGYNNAGGYGLTWQVVSSPPGVNVYGTVSGSLIHDCELGVNGWSGNTVSWTGNEITANRLFGFEPGNALVQAVLARNAVYDNLLGATARWVASSERIYVTGPGDATLSDITMALPNVPQLALVDPTNRVWYLGADLYVVNGAKLKLHGSAVGGDVAELRMKSDNTTATNAFVEIRADWGWLDIRSTKITSWDNARNGPDTEMEQFRRAFIHVRSTLDPDGVTAHESRMDVIDSDVGYLGSHNSEAYGLSWKVVETTSTNLPPNSTHTIFDVVNVYGDILNSRLHHMFFGVYTYGHHGGRWANNEVDHNEWYGLDPHDDSDYLVIENNNVHHNGRHGIITSKRCNHAIIRNNLSWANGGNGIMLHRHGNYSLVESNRSVLNRDSGISVFDTDSSLIRGNVCLSNANAGIRMSVGSYNNWVEGNEIGYSGTNGFYLFAGGDPPEPDDDNPITTARCRQNTFTNNFLHNYRGEPIKITAGDENLFIANVFVGATNLLRFQDSSNNVVCANIMPTNVAARMVGSITNAPVTNIVTGQIQFVTVTNWTSTIFRDQPAMSLEQDTNSLAIFTDSRGGVFYSDQTNLTLTTTVTPTGSQVAVPLAFIDRETNTTVNLRRLWAVPDAGTVMITPQTWSTSPTASKTWTAVATSDTAAITYRVGDLQPGIYFGVKSTAPTVLLASAIADPTGVITVTANTNTTLLSGTHTLTAFLSGPNTQPRPPTQATRTISELTPLTVDNHATDSDSPAQILTYTLLAAPANATLSPRGIITWTPTEAQGPSTNIFTMLATDNGGPPLSATNSFTVIVLENNLAPALPAQTTRTISPGTTLVLANTATDPDLPAQTLRYQLRFTPSAFKETGGLIVMEAEHFQTNRSASGHFWQTMTDRTGYVGASAMQALPNNGTTISSSIQTTSPALSYYANFTNTGTYNLWVRAFGEKKSDDSVYIAVDAGAPQTVNLSTAGAWTWRAQPVTISTPGVHQINLWMREDGAYVDRLVLAANLAYTPTGNGPPESPGYLPPDAPVNLPTIDANGVITWTPTPAQAPSTNLITTIVTDNGIPPLSATNTFIVVVTGGNTAPVLPAQPDRVITAFSTMTVNNTATDADSPPNLLSYQLLTAPAGAAINHNGVITWTPTATQAASTNPFTTLVTDNGQPPLSATNRFTVYVSELPLQPMILRIQLTPTNTALITWPAPAPGWTLQESAALSSGSWANSPGQVSVAGARNQVIVSPPAGAKFYRLFHP